MSDFTVHLPTQVLFGCGRLAEAGQLCVGKGTRACLVTGSQPERADVLRDELAALGLDPHVVPVTGEPSLKFAEEACASARDAGCDLVVSCGGGSVLDAGKAIAAFLTNGGALIDYLEGVGGGQPLTHRAVFHLAIPTTAGTGAEVTKNAVLSVTEQRVKVSMRSDLMFPHIALVDPELTRSAPESVTIAAGLDALTQLVEAYITPFANPVTDGLCHEGLIRAGRSIRQVVAEPDDLAARADLSLAACFSGMALALAKLGVVHGIAGPLGGMSSVTGFANGVI